MYFHSLILFVMSPAVPLCVPSSDCPEPPPASHQLFTSYKYNGFFYQRELRRETLLSLRQAEPMFVSLLRFLQNSLKFFLRGVTEKLIYNLVAYRQWKYSIPWENICKMRQNYITFCYINNRVRQVKFGNACERSIKCTLSSPRLADESVQIHNYNCCLISDWILVSQPKKVTLE